MATCTHCSAMLADDASFCHKCGAAADNPAVDLGLRRELEAAMAEQDRRLGDLEQALEAALGRVKSLEQSGKNTSDWLRYFESKTDGLPKSAIMSTSFWSRAFAVWGHVLAVQFVISAIIWIVAIAIGSGS